ncbi:N-6 DNA methylase [Oceanobacillus iheyensis]|uniref:N-6 DNA methylase n=1 Tax=Oceanobacillus iheyensis TaxID=182710 RepID=UPI00363244D3
MLDIKSRDEVIFETNRKKRLGQYFSGEKLSKLLSAFAVYPEYNSIIDPMCGKADMLVAASLFNTKAELYGIDIDEGAIKAAIKNLETNNKFIDIHYLYKANALSSQILSKIPFLQFDLVITNPPYVRYQSLSNNAEGEELPIAEEVRGSLLEIIKGMNHLEIEDKRIFTEIVKGYSGLSDLAVPSWILCALLTKLDGRLAMVVPEAWLNRDYSYPIQYLLFKYFDLEYVIEDVDRCWFNEAQIKTNLVVAKRRTRASDLFKHNKGKQYVHISIREEHGDETSLIGNLVGDSQNKELTFKNELQHNLENYASKGICHLVKMSDTLENLAVNCQNYSWYKNVEGSYKPKKVNTHTMNLIPPLLKKVVGKSSAEFVTLEDIGVKIGQGLRTGANKFFYVDYVKDDGDFSVVKVDKIFKKGTVKVPAELLAPVVRKQAELPSGFTVNSTDITGRILILDKVIHPKDLEEIKELHGNRVLMNKDLSDFIDEVEETNVGSEVDLKYIPNLSAVKTNKKKMKGNDPNTINYWYMLPKMAPRHKPDIFVPRIINNIPKFMLNNDSLIIDANFSTIWLLNEVELDKYGLLALLNSSWFLLVCELMGSVMGGGALKLEATHLKRAPVPRLSKIQYEKLSILGKKLINGDEGVKTYIDQIIMDLISPNSSTLLMEKIEELTLQKRYARNKK